jgi:hypothetical protein
MSKMREDELVDPQVTVWLGPGETKETVVSELEAGDLILSVANEEGPREILKVMETIIRVGYHGGRMLVVGVTQTGEFEEAA